MLLLVDDAQPKVDFAGLFKLGVHLEHGRERLLGMLKGPISVVEDADAVPQFRVLFCSLSAFVCLVPCSIYLWVGQVVQRLLVRPVGLLEVLHHEVAVAQCTPHLAVVGLDAEDACKVVDCLVRERVCVH